MMRKGSVLGKDQHGLHCLDMVFAEPRSEAITGRWPRILSAMSRGKLMRPVLGGSPRLLRRSASSGRMRLFDNSIQRSLS